MPTNKKKLCKGCNRVRHNDARNKFCSYKCYLKWMKGKPRPSRQKWIKKNCPVCRKDFTTGGEKGSVEKECCSYDCRGILSRKNLDVDQTVSLNSSAWRRRRDEIRIRDKNSCRFCGWNKGTLQVNHMIPRWIKIDHRKRNLALACYPCHKSLDNMIRIMLRGNPDFDLQAWFNSWYKNPED